MKPADGNGIMESEFYLPWSVQKARVSGAPMTQVVDSGEQLVVDTQSLWNDRGRAERMAAFIVLACNAHDDLLAACEKLVAEVSTSKGVTLLGTSLVQMQAAIEKAKGGVP